MNMKSAATHPITSNPVAFAASARDGVRESGMSSGASCSARAPTANANRPMKTPKPRTVANVSPSLNGREGSTGSLSHSKPRKTAQKHPTIAHPHRTVGNMNRYERISAYAGHCHERRCVPRSAEEAPNGKDSAVFRAVKGMRSLAITKTFPMEDDLVLVWFCEVDSMVGACDRG